MSSPRGLSGYRPGAGGQPGPAYRCRGGPSRMTPSSLTPGEMTLSALELDEAGALIRRALDEDLRYGPDVTTSATVAADSTATARLVAREPGVVAGRRCCTAGARSGPRFRRLSQRRTDRRWNAGRRRRCVVGGSCPDRGLLTAERTLLNLVCHLSGVATWQRLRGSRRSTEPRRIRDTRKTLPGLRALQKYAVRVGGGVNHRMGLGDAALIKDNHVAAAGSGGGCFAGRSRSGTGSSVRSRGRHPGTTGRGAGRGRAAGVARQFPGLAKRRSRSSAATPGRRASCSSRRVV